MWLVKVLSDTLMITSNTIPQVVSCACRSLGKERGLLVNRFFHFVRAGVQNLFVEAVTIDLSPGIKVTQSAPCVALTVFSATIHQGTRTLPIQEWIGRMAAAIRRSRCSITLPLSAQPELA